MTEASWSWGVVPTWQRVSVTAMLLASLGSPSPSRSTRLVALYLIPIHSCRSSHIIVETPGLMAEAI